MKAHTEERAYTRTSGPKRLPVQAPPLCRVQLIKERRRVIGEPISGPEEAYAIFSPLIEFADREHFAVILMDSPGRPLGVHIAHTGTLSMALVGAREIFRVAILANAASVILSHSHPSGDTKPSPEDLTATENLVKAGYLLDIPVEDHLILGDGEWLSLRRSHPKLFRSGGH